MAKTQYIEFRDAVSVSLDIEIANECAHLHFLVRDSDPLVVTIPLAQLGSLHADISRRLAQEPTLFDLASRKRRRNQVHDQD